VPIVRDEELLRRPVWHASGDYLGRIIDLVIEPDPPGGPRVVAVLVDKTWHARLLGYQRPYVHGPWLIERLARMLYRDTRRVPWAEVRLDRPAAATNDGTA
jgi:hypothetical protein